MPTLANAGGTNDGVLGTTTSHQSNGVVGQNSDVTPRNAANPTGHGVLGTTQVPDGAGVFGTHSALGIGTGGVGLIGVWGGSVNGVGVVGVSAPPGAKGGDGVQGITNSEIRNGIYGRNDATTMRGTNEPAGNGVLGYSRVPDGAGVMGVSGAGGIGVSGASTAHGVMGNGRFGVTGIGSIIGVWGVAQGTGWAGQFAGPVLVLGSAFFKKDMTIDSTLTVNNPAGECVHAETQSSAVAAVAAFQKNSNSDSAALYAKHDGGRMAALFEGSVVVTRDIALANAVVTGDITLTNAADCAEEFDIAETSPREPGMVMVLGTGGQLEACSQAYDKRVIGVISGAATFRPGIVLDKQSDRPGRKPIALMGKVYCKTDASYGKIEIGDLLTTSLTEGHAMRADFSAAAFGAIIGKAMQPLDHGCGLIPVLIALK
jgi:hypothetical protein